MVWHVVLLKPKPDLTAAARQALIDSFAGTVRAVPSVRDVRLGTRVTHGAAYESLMPDSADFFICIAFDDRPGLEAYLRHPAHAGLGAHFRESCCASLVYDFDVAGLEKLDELR